MVGPLQIDDDRQWMRTALSLAARGLGTVAPNPAVGCVLVKDGAPVGRGWTQPGGRPHAETEALRRAGEAARGSTAYVSLEPCSHVGKTGPCADALIAAGVTRCVVAMVDPDARVAGRGLRRLRDAGIEVVTGIEEAAAHRLNRGFVLHRTEGRPLVTLKSATTLDGRIATASGESQWITGPEARSDAHLLRMTHDAVMVGIRTALADDPALTCRLPGIGRHPVRVVLDGDGRLPKEAALRDGTAPTLQVVADDTDASSMETVTVLAVPRNESGKLDPGGILRALAGEGITRLMIEGGGQVAGSFLEEGLIDRLVWYRAGKIIGGGGRAAIASLGIEALTDMPAFRMTGARAVGADWVEEYDRA